MHVWSCQSAVVLLAVPHAPHLQQRGHQDTGAPLLPLKKRWLILPVVLENQYQIGKYASKSEDLARVPAPGVSLLAGTLVYRHGPKSGELDHGSRTGGNLVQLGSCALCWRFSDAES